MCGRYALYGPSSRLAAHFAVDFAALHFAPRYNLAPMQWAPVIRWSAGQRELALARWGLLPAWARDPAMAGRLINARSETAAEKPAFRSAFRSRRCLVPADGFFEWKALASGKQPYFIRRRDEMPLALAGLWEPSTAPDGAAQCTFTILTAESGTGLAEIHPRMPVMLPPEAWGLWLNPARSPAQVLPLMGAAMTTELAWWPVSRRVGKVAEDDAGLLDRIDALN